MQGANQDKNGRGWLGHYRQRHPVYKVYMPLKPVRLHRVHLIFSSSAHMGGYS